MLGDACGFPNLRTVRLGRNDYNLKSMGWNQSSLIPSILMSNFRLLMLSFLRSGVRRPLSNAHIVFPLVLTMGWAFVVLNQHCSEPPHYLETVFATFTVCTVAWAAHLRAGSANGWHKVVAILASTIYDLFLLILALVVVIIPISIFLPTNQCYTPRAKEAEFILAASSIRTEINERFASRKTLQGIGVGLSVRVEGRVKGGIVTTDGDIVMASEDPPSVVILSPKLTGGVVEWKCLGFPSTHMPTNCR